MLIARQRRSELRARRQSPLRAILRSSRSRLEKQPSATSSTRGRPPRSRPAPGTMAWEYAAIGPDARSARGFEVEGVHASNFAAEPGCSARRRLPRPIAASRARDGRSSSSSNTLISPTRPSAALGIADNADRAVIRDPGGALDGASGADRASGRADGGTSRWPAYALRPSRRAQRPDCDGFGAAAPVALDRGRRDCGRLLACFPAAGTAGASWDRARDLAICAAIRRREPERGGAAGLRVRLGHADMVPSRCRPAAAAPPGDG